MVVLHGSAFHLQLTGVYPARTWRKMRLWEHWQPWLSLPSPLRAPPTCSWPRTPCQPLPPPQCRQPLPPAMPQLGFSQPFPAWPWPPLARPMHESTSRPSLSLSPSPGRHLMAGAAPVPLAAQFLAGAVGWALAASPCLGAPSMGAPDAPSTQVAAGSSCPLPWKKL